MHNLVIFCGISGSGKSTVGRFVSQEKNYTFIEGDDFFLPDKPKYTLSDGSTCSNWDCPEAIDWNRLNLSLSDNLTRSNVILSTFLPLVKYITHPIHLQIELVTARANKDRLSVKELVIHITKLC